MPVYVDEVGGSDVVDRAVVDGAVNYIVRRQSRDGSFSIIGRVHNYQLMVCYINDLPL